MKYPLRHISIRVPWHDTAWDGRVCARPCLNADCVKLKRIAEGRDDAKEDAVAGQSINDLPEDKWPCCVAERVGFMAPFSYTKTAKHPYSRTSPDTHGHFAETPLRFPQYSAAAVPFAWTLRQAMDTLGEEYCLDVDPQREPNLPFDTSWIQDHTNQRALLECFAEHLVPEKSLCFFYAKQVPFVEDTVARRVLIGVGRVLHVSPLQEYNYTVSDLSGKLRSVLWERMVQHSIRPDFKDGFLLPYHAAVDKADADPDFDPADIVALSPDDRLLEFSHVSQLVTNDGAISALLACADSLRKAKGVIPGPWDQCLDWIDARLGELWKIRGPYPGLGAALSAFGIELGNFVAQAVIDRAGENADPWPLVQEMFDEPAEHLPAHLAKNIGSTLSATWKRLPDDRRALLKLVSRFEITREQAARIYVEEERQRAGIDISSKDILANPYAIYEITRLTADPISFSTIDRGVFPDEVVRLAHPLPEPSALDAGTDARRVRALTVKVLEDAAAAGNTLLPQDHVVLTIRDMAMEPPCDVNADLMAVAKDSFGTVVSEVPMANDSPALQLGRLAEMGSIIRTAIDKRIDGARLAVEADWRRLLDDHLGPQDPDKVDELEDRARSEKTAALKELAESRVSVLIGQAGTGKTTLLSVLCAQPQIAEGGILLLAPTGKARVRIEQSTRRLNLTGYTIAQFLAPHRYDVSTGQYRLSDRRPEPQGRTVIVDEASMLTEEMLAALIQALKGVDRLILIGDPRQLPPIGAGRPFMDIVKRLRPADIAERPTRVDAGYAELTVQRRQTGIEREDLQLAEWFSGSAMAPGEDEVFDSVVRTGNSRHVRFAEWQSPDDLRERVIEVLVDELGLEGPNDVRGFDLKLGAEEWNELRFFNPGTAEKAESWQILSPVRAAAHGVSDLNRLIHRQFREDMVVASTERYGKYTRPMGPEKIVYGDKVLNLVNTNPSLSRYRHRRVYPAKENAYIANGEIGLAVGFYRRKGLPDLRWKLEVEFSSQPNHKYDFTGQDFREEGNPVLELAYALTVHKSQGSEFGIVILVLPNPCRLLTRELLYTALTRQKDRVVILHQGPRIDLKKYSSDNHSETARRLTNLFAPPMPVVIDGRMYEENLIHRTTSGIMVRSKSEVIIADHLDKHKILYEYEQPLIIDSVPKYPDFTIEDEDSGITVYWEHCGMLHVPSYKRRWENKLAWYRSNDIIPYEEGGGKRGTLVVTRDAANGSVDSAQIEALLKEVFNV